jgi:hypothetical protein
MLAHLPTALVHLQDGPISQERLFFHLKSLDRPSRPIAD